MKKQILLLILIVLSCLPIFAQGNLEAETFTFSAITEAVKIFVMSVNWLYVLSFMLLSWLVNDGTEAQNATTFLNFLSHISKTTRTLIVGTLLILVFSYFFSYNTRSDVFKMLLSLLLSMVIYKLGINKVFAFISSRIGFKFE